MNLSERKNLLILFLLRILKKLLFSFYSSVKFHLKDPFSQFFFIFRIDGDIDLFDRISSKNSFRKFFSEFEIKLKQILKKYKIFQNSDLMNLVLNFSKFLSERLLFYFLKYSRISPLFSTKSPSFN